MSALPKISGHQRHALKLLSQHESPTMMFDLDGRTVRSLFRKRLIKRGMCGVRRLTKKGERYV